MARSKRRFTAHLGSEVNIIRTNIGRSNATPTDKFRTDLHTRLSEVLVAEYQKARKGASAAATSVKVWFTAGKDGPKIGECRRHVSLDEVRDGLPFHLNDVLTEAWAKLHAEQFPKEKAA